MMKFEGLARGWLHLCIGVLPGHLRRHPWILPRSVLNGRIDNLPSLLCKNLSVTEASSWYPAPGFLAHRAQDLNVGSDIDYHVDNHLRPSHGPESTPGSPVQVNYRTVRLRCTLPEDLGFRVGLPSVFTVSRKRISCSWSRMQMSSRRAHRPAATVSVPN